MIEKTGRELGPFPDRLFRLMNYLRPAFFAARPRRPSLSALALAILS